MVIPAKMFAKKLTSVRCLNERSFLFKRESGLMIACLGYKSSRSILKRQHLCIKL